MLWSTGLSGPVDETVEAAGDAAVAAKVGMGGRVVEIA